MKFISDMSDPYVMKIMEELLIDDSNMQIFRKSVPGNFDTIDNHV